MKKYLFLIYLFFPLISFCQNAFNDTKILIKYESLLNRSDLRELMDIYLEKTDFDSIDYVELELVLFFMEDPFREDFDYDNFDPIVVIDLSEYIIENTKTKNEIFEEDYHLILECDASFPEDYDTFIEDDKVVLDNATSKCYRKKYLEKYPPVEPELAYDSDADGVIDMIDQEPNLPPGPGMTTKIVDATAQFLVDRVKEELLLAFFDRFLAQVDQSTELTALMPNTYFLLKNNDIFKVPSMGEVWMTAFEEDLNAIPQNFHTMVQTHPDYMEVKTKPELQLFMMAGFIYDKIQEESNLLEIVESFYEKFEDGDTQLIQMLGVVGIIRENLRVNDNNEVLVSRNDFRNLFEENAEASLYFSALVYQQERGLFDSIKVPQLNTQLILGDLIKTNFVDFTKMTGKFLKSMKKLEESKSEFDDKKYLKDQQKEKYQEAVLTFASDIFEFLDFSIELAYFSNPDDYFTSSYFQIYRPVAQKTIKAIGAGQKKDYGQLMIYSMQMMEPLVQVRIDYLEKKLANGHDKKIKQELKILQSVVKNFMYYGGFMVDVLSANSTQDIKGIINKYAAPVGSYRVKRQSQFSVSLSSYPGLYGGWETTDAGSENESFVTGVTAPIGLSLNWGNSFYGMRAKGHSFSVYAPIVDIGAAFSYRWNNSEGEGFPEEIKWEQIISPGVHAVWGIGNTPMALMIGAQYTPLLRKITDQNNELQQNAWRFGATICVDIPIFHFYRSDK